MFDSLQRTIHSVGNQTTPVVLYVIDSLKRTGSSESFVLLSDNNGHTGWFPFILVIRFLQVLSPPPPPNSAFQVFNDRCAVFIIILTKHKSWTLLTCICLVIATSSRSSRNATLSLCETARLNNCQLILVKFQVTVKNSSIFQERSF